MLESPAFLAQILAGPHGRDAQLDPEGSPPGAVIRVLFDDPFLGQDQQTGVFANTRPQAYAREADVAGVVPELTVLRIASVDYTANRLEPVEGGAWRLLLLNEVA